jgi:multiple sugar transport system permease protein
MSTTLARRSEHAPGVAAEMPPLPERPRRRWNLTGYLFLVPAVLFVVATVLYPLLYNIAQSFFDVGLRQVTQGGAVWVGLENYADQFGRPAFWRSLGVTLVYAFGTVAVTFLLGMGLALVFRRVYRGRNVLRALILIAWVLPSVVSANVWRWLLDGSYGLLNSALNAVGLIDGDVFWLGQPTTAVIAVIMATAWTFGPLAMIMLSAGMEGISPTLYEAARIDGATPWQQFRRITLPLLKPVSLTAGLLIFIFTFKTFDTIFLMTGGGPGNATETLPVYAYNEAFAFSRFDTAAVATVVLLVVPIMLSAVYFRAIRSEENA